MENKEEKNKVEVLIHSEHSKFHIYVSLILDGSHLRKSDDTLIAKASECSLSRSAQLFMDPADNTVTSMGTVV